MSIMMIIINHLMNMDDIRQSTKNLKEFETLIQAVRIHSDDIRMEFDLRKCIMLIKKKWNIVNDRRNWTTRSRKIRTLIKKVTYKYLRILEADSIKQAEKKEKVEYLRRTRKLLKT